MRLSTENLILLIRLILITGNAMLFAFLVTMNAAFYWALIAGLLMIIQIIQLFRFIDQLRKRIAIFFRSVKNGAHGFRFDEDLPSETIRAIHIEMNRINAMIQDNKMQLRQQERYYQDLLEKVSTGILTIDKRGFVILANTSAKSLLGIEILSHIDQLERIDPRLYNHLRSQAPKARILVNLQGRDSVRDISVITSEIGLRDEKLFLVILQDIKKELDHKEMESWIRLIRVQAHEIRNSMAPIASMSESLLKQTKETRTRKGLNIILERSTHLAKFVESYRQLTHPPEPELSMFRLSEVIDRTRVLLSDQPNFSKVNLRIVGETENIDLKADKNQLNQVLINLLRNSYEALDQTDQGEITIRTDKEPHGMVRICIRDNGPGIEQSQIEEIFIPFFTTKENGTGIGLSLSKQIIRQHGGDISVRSVIGKETEFCILLP